MYFSYQNYYAIYSKKVSVITKTDQWNGIMKWNFGMEVRFFASSYLFHYAIPLILLNNPRLIKLLVFVQIKNDIISNSVMWL